MPRVRIRCTQTADCSHRGDESQAVPPRNRQNCPRCQYGKGALAQPCMLDRSKFSDTFFSPRIHNYSPRIIIHQAPQLQTADDNISIQHAFSKVRYGTAMLKKTSPDRNQTTIDNQRFKRHCSPIPRRGLTTG